MLKISETFMWNRTNFVFSRTGIRTILVRELELKTGIRTNLLRELELKKVGIRPKMRNETQGENGIVSKGIISKVSQSIKRAFDISLSSSAPRFLGAAYVLIAYTEYAPSLEGDSTENFVRHLRKVKFYSWMKWFEIWHFYRNNGRKNNDCINFMLINCITLLLYYFHVPRYQFAFCTLFLSASAFVLLYYFYVGCLKLNMSWFCQFDLRNCKSCMSKVVLVLFPLVLFQFWS